MFQVGQTILSEEIAHARFACDISRCKGACCVVGVSGAPIDAAERLPLQRAWELLKGELDPEAVRTVERDGLFKKGSRGGWELACVGQGACVFATRNEQGASICAIQNAWMEGRFHWEKPVSCHLYPIRLSRIADVEYANFEYLPELCGAGCDRGEMEGIWLSEFLKPALRRRFGEAWVSEFDRECERIRGGG